MSRRPALSLRPWFYPQPRLLYRPLARLPLLDDPLQLADAAAQVASHGWRGNTFGQPPGQAGAGDAVGEPQLDAGASLAGVAQAEAPALIDPRHRGPRQLAVGHPL